MSRGKGESIVTSNTDVGPKQSSSPKKCQKHCGFSTGTEEGFR